MDDTAQPVQAGQPVIPTMPQSVPDASLQPSPPKKMSPFIWIIAAVVIIIIVGILSILFIGGTSTPTPVEAPKVASSSPVLKNSPVPTASTSSTLLATPSASAASSGAKLKASPTASASATVSATLKL